MLALRMPDVARARVRAALTLAVASTQAEGPPAEKPARKWGFARSPWVYAAASLLVACAAAVAYLLPIRGQSARLPVLLSSGSAAELVVTGAHLKLRAGHLTELLLKQPGLLVLQLPKGASLELNGPGAYGMEATQGSIRVRVLTGRVFVHRPERAGTNKAGTEPTRTNEPTLASPGPTLRWETTRGTYSMVGTTAALSVDSAGESLLVLSGRFALQPTGGRNPPRNIVAGESSTWPRQDREPVVAVMSGEQQDSLKLAAARHGILAAGGRGIDPFRRFQSEAELRAFYGRIESVDLKDGRSYRGYITKLPGHIEIHTVRGVILIPEDRIEPVTTDKRGLESP